MDKFLPAKVLTEQYAARLYRYGEVYMRALREFGLWDTLGADESVRNNYRGDAYSGTLETYSSPDESTFFGSFPEPLKSSLKNLRLIDAGCIQYFKIYSLACLDFDGRGFIRMSERMAQFGSAAVVITDFSEFLARLNVRLIEGYGNITLLCDKISWFDTDETKPRDPLFSKHISHSYQNELRIATCPLEVPDDTFPYGRMIADAEPIKVRLGSLEDIATLVRTEDLVTGSTTFPACRIVWPSSGDEHHPSYYDTIVGNTRLQMSEYEPGGVLPAFSI